MIVTMGGCPQKSIMPPIVLAENRFAKLPRPQTSFKRKSLSKCVQRSAKYKLGFNEKKDGAKHRKIQEEMLLQTVKDLRLRLRFTFQQENDLMLTAKAILE